MGVANYLRKWQVPDQKGEEFGKALEHFILMEIVAYRSYKEKDFEINFWRTKTGLEVDFILAGGQVSIKVKGSSRIDQKDFYPSEAFAKEYFPKKSLIVCNEKSRRIHGSIEVIPWRDFLAELWSGSII